MLVLDFLILGDGYLGGLRLVGVLDIGWGGKKEERLAGCMYSTVPVTVTVTCYHGITSSYTLPLLPIPIRIRGIGDFPGFESTSTY